MKSKCVRRQVCLLPTIGVCTDLRSPLVSFEKGGGVAGSIVTMDAQYLGRSEIQARHPLAVSAKDK